MDCHSGLLGRWCALAAHIVFRLGCSGVVTRIAFAPKFKEFMLIDIDAKNWGKRAYGSRTDQVTLQVAFVDNHTS